MRDEPGFAETLVSLLGTPHDPWAALIGFAIVAAAAAAWIALEQAGARGLARLLRLRPPKDSE